MRSIDRSIIRFSVNAPRRRKMAKRKRSSTSRPRTRSTAAKERREAKTSETGVEEDDKEFRQLTQEFSQLEGKRAKLSSKQHKLEQKVKNEQRKLEEQQRKLEELKRDMEEQLRPLRREVEQFEQNWLPKKHRLKDVCSAREVENAKHLDKLPHEVWGKILDTLKENDLFPLALSCRYFRQKQKELLARPRQRELELLESPHRASATNILRWPQKGQRASAEYLRFIRKEKVPRDICRQKAKYVRWLAAYHGHLPLLQELLAGLKTLKYKLPRMPVGLLLHSLFIFGLASDLFLSFSSSQRVEANWRPCSG